MSILTGAATTAGKGFSATEESSGFGLADKFLDESTSTFSGGGDTDVDFGVDADDFESLATTTAAAGAGWFHAVLGGADSAGATALPAGPQAGLAGAAEAVLAAASAAASPTSGLPQTVFCWDGFEDFLPVSLLLLLLLGVAALEFMLDPWPVRFPPPPPPRCPGPPLLPPGASPPRGLPVEADPDDEAETSRYF